MSTRPWPVAHVLLAASLLLWCRWTGQAQSPSLPAPASSSLHSTALAIDLIVVDRMGTVPDGLAPADVRVTIGGRVRPVLWIRRVSRGPGAAADAATRRARGYPALVYVAEPSRTVLIVVDEASIPLGGERQAIQGAAAFLDRLGMADRVSVTTVPFLTGRMPAPTAERPAVRDALNRVVGRIPTGEVTVDGVTPDSQHIASDAFGNRANQSDKPERPEPLGGAAGSDDGPPASRDSLGGLIGVLKASASLPGRKTVVFFSAGLDDRSVGRIGEAVRVAAEARAVLYVFGLRASSDARYSRLDSKLLGRLARAAGGVFMTLGRNPAKDVEVLAPELSACFQLGIERTPEDPNDGVFEVRVEAARADLTVRAGSLLALRAPDTVDVEPPHGPAVAVPSAPARQLEDYRGAGRLSPGATAPVPVSPSSPELDVALGRLSDYVQAYIGQYSAVVAEEEYKQSQSGQHKRLRSDVLFVKSEPSQEWVSFRDVFEVNGTPVRDRDDRLKSLFLGSHPNAQAQLRAIKDESSRHNIGPFERNINVPLYALKFLTPAHRHRFAFSRGRVSETSGVKTWQVDYVERARPTLVLDREGRDVPLEGRFLVEQATGAILESTIRVDRPDYAVSIVVRFVRDPKLGLWVPSEMKETYRVPSSVGAVLEGVAKYRNFRRFQVSTEEKVVVPK